LVCGAEPSFTELFAVLGDQAAQDLIRAETPDKVHCPLLADDPNKCTSCKGNPANKEKKKGEEDVDPELWREAIEDGFELFEKAELGFLRDESRVSPEEMTILRIFYREIGAHRAKSVSSAFKGK